MRDGWIGSIVFAAIIFLFVWANRSIVYGVTETPIKEPFANQINDDFETVFAFTREKWDVKEIREKRGNRIVKFKSDKEGVLCPYGSLYEKNGRLDMVELASDLYSKSDARDLMEHISRGLSKEYTNGKGIRRYRRSRNIVINKEQEVMLEIRMEQDFDEYRIHMYLMDYSLTRRIGRALYWRTIALERPGINIGNLFIPR